MELRSGCLLATTLSALLSLQYQLLQPSGSLLAELAALRRNAPWRGKGSETA